MSDNHAPEISSHAELERRLRTLIPEPTSNPAHREHLQRQVEQAREAYLARHCRVADDQATAGRWLIRFRPRLSVPMAAAVVFAIVAVWASYTGKGPLDGASPAWALDQSIAALQGVRTMHLSGSQGNGKPFECWIRPKGAGDEIEALRFESPDLVAVIFGGKVSAYRPLDRAAQLVQDDCLSAVRTWQWALQLRPWVGDTLLTRLKMQAGDWQEWPMHDARGRDCVFVRCSLPALGISYDLTFDTRTKLVSQARQWQNVTHDGEPAFDVRQVEYNQDLPDERFELSVPDGATVLDAGETLEQRTLLDRAEALNREKKYAEAIEVYQQVYELYPQWTGAETALKMIGLCHENLGRLDLAIEYLERAVREYPDLRGWSESTYFYLGSAYARVGRRDEAIQAFQKSIELCRGVRSPEAFPWRHARQALLEIESSRPANTGGATGDALTNAHRLFTEHRYAEAASLYHQIVQSSAGNAEAWMMLGLCQSNLGNDAEALAAYRESVGREPDRPGFSEARYFYLACQLARMGDSAAAGDAYRQCVALCERVPNARDPNGFPWKQAAAALRGLDAGQR